jgi:hypothetical protein
MPKTPIPEGIPFPSGLTGDPERGRTGATGTLDDQQIADIVAYLLALK